MSPATLRAADLFRYRLPLTRPLVMPSGTYVEREGVLLRLTAEDGTVGWGEAAPLPGYSPDTLNQAVTWLRVWARGEPTATGVGSGGPSPSRERLASILSHERFASIPKHSPAASWAVVQAGADIEAQQTGRSLAEVYAARARRGRPAATISLNALLVGTRAEVLSAARQAAASGYRAAKLKVGGLAPDAAAALTREVAGALGVVSLRLDANRAWSLDQAVAFAEAVDGVDIEYVEEPLADPADLPRLARRAPLRWALDESLHRAAETPEIAAALGAAVVKPMLEPALVWWAALVMAGMWGERQVAGLGVVSSTFESGVGMRHLVALAAALGDTPAGLDTYRWLADDVLERPLSIGGAVVDVSDVLAPNPVRLDRVTPLDL